MPNGNLQAVYSYSRSPWRLFVNNSNWDRSASALVWCTQDWYFCWIYYTIFEWRMHTIFVVVVAFLRPSSGTVVCSIHNRLYTHYTHVLIVLIYSSLFICGTVALKSGCTRDPRGPEMVIKQILQGIHPEVHSQWKWGCRVLITWFSVFDRGMGHGYVFDILPWWSSLQEYFQLH